jgi:hypothetical protein
MSRRRRPDGRRAAEIVEDRLGERPDRTLSGRTAMKSKSAMRI